MPIKIYPRGEPAREVAWLCDGDWDLSSQASKLEAWLKRNKRKIKKGDYIADIGFSVEEDARGGGAALSPAMMRTLADIGIWLFLSQYPSHLRGKKPNQTLETNRRRASRF